MGSSPLLAAQIALQGKTLILNILTVHMGGLPPIPPETVKERGRCQQQRLSCLSWCQPVASSHPNLNLNPKRFPLSRVEQKCHFLLTSAMVVVLALARHWSFISAPSVTNQSQSSVIVHTLNLTLSSTPGPATPIGPSYHQSSLDDYNPHWIPSFYSLPPKHPPSMRIFLKFKYDHITPLLKNPSDIP